MNTIKVILRGACVLALLVALFGAMVAMVLGPATLAAHTGNDYWAWLYAPVALPFLYSIGRNFE